MSPILKYATRPVFGELDPTDWRAERPLVPIKRSAAEQSSDATVKSAQQTARKVSDSTTGLVSRSTHRLPEVTAKDRTISLTDFYRSHGSGIPIYPTTGK
jgi:hypothetical protein